MKTPLLVLALLLAIGPAFARSTPPTAATRPSASQVPTNFTNTYASANPDPSFVGTPVTFTVLIEGFDFYNYLDVNEGTVTFSEGATVLGNANVTNNGASFSTSSLTLGNHTIKVTYNGTANFGASSTTVALTVIATDPSCPTYTNNIAYVNASAAVGTNDGTTWARAFLTLEAALNAARTCGVTQIWVAQGTYVPSAYPPGAVPAPDNKGPLTNADFSFHLVDGVAVYGGFNGTETELSQRNWRQNPTILSGNNTCYHVVTSTMDGSATRLDGFTVTGGKAIPPYSYMAIVVESSRSYLVQQFGGGVYSNNSSFQLANLVITGNSGRDDIGFGGQGGLWIQDGSPTLTNVAITNNTAGGMMYNTDPMKGQVITMKNVVFANNTSQAGTAGLVLNGKGPTAYLTNVVFANNTSTSSDNGYGGALRSGLTVGSINLANCTFYGNSATIKGGAMYVDRQTIVKDINSRLVAKLYISNLSKNSRVLRIFPASYHRPVGHAYAIDWTEPDTVSCHQFHALRPLARS